MNTIPTADVRFVKELYPRLKPHDDVIERYRDAIDKLPPIVVARDGVLVDGYHRWQAHVREGCESIPADNLGKPGRTPFWLIAKKYGRPFDEFFLPPNTTIDAQDMSLIKRFATPIPTICAVCRRRACWIGYSPNNQPPIWLCGTTECSRLAKVVYTMKTYILDAYEHGARIEASQAFGAYIEECGTTDLAKLTEEQWDEGWTRAILTYEKAMIRKIQSNETPF